MSRLSLILIVGALLCAALILILGFLLQSPSLLPDRDDEGFPDGLRGKVPEYRSARTNESRDCYVPAPGVEYCYYVFTEADDKRSVALIVQDIIRNYDLEETQERMVWVSFQTPEGAPSFAAYAFKDKAAAKRRGPRDSWTTRRS